MSAEPRYNNDERKLFMYLFDELLGLLNFLAKETHDLHFIITRRSMDVLLHDLENTINVTREFLERMEKLYKLFEESMR